MSGVKDPTMAKAIDGLRAAVDALAAAGVDPFDDADARVLVRELAEVSNRVRALDVRSMEAIDRLRLYQVDGHGSAKIAVRHLARLSDLEAGRRFRAAKALRKLPEARDAFEEGRIGPCQVNRIAKTYANPRVRKKFEAQDGPLTRLARTLSYKDFDERLTVWEQLMDEDGTLDRAERSHQNRDFTHRAEFDGSWSQHGGCGSLQGAEISAIFERFVSAELLEDWRQARLEHGPEATIDQLPRTAAQRRADAFYAMSQRAATALADSEGGSRITTDIVIDHRTFERWARIITGDDVDPLDLDLDLHPIDTDEDDDEDDDDGDDEDHDDEDHDDDDGAASGGEAGDGRPDSEHPEDEGPGGERPAAEPPARAARGGVGYRCSTLDGQQVHPAEAVGEALVGHIRRVVVDSASVTIDLGRRTRLFTGASQLAVRVNETTCTWPGCEVPVTRTQTDHNHPWSARDGTPGGPTSPSNGGPKCGRHNRLKERGYRVHHDEFGVWHTYRPDGTEILGPGDQPT